MRFQKPAFVLQRLHEQEALLDDPEREIRLVRVADRFRDEDRNHRCGREMVEFQRKPEAGAHLAAGRDRRLTSPGVRRAPELSRSYQPGVAFTCRQCPLGGLDRRRVSLLE